MRMYAWVFEGEREIARLREREKVSQKMCVRERDSEIEREREKVSKKMCV
jgi:hypothetical protein